MIRSFRWPAVALLLVTCSFTLPASAQVQPAQVKRQVNKNATAANPAVNKNSQVVRQTVRQHQSTKSPSPGEQVSKLVHDALARNTFYKPGFLISRKDLEPVFSKLLEKGLTNIDNQEELTDLVLSDSAQLTKLLKTPDGREFMKKLGNDPALYDRLERLSWTYDGRRLIEKLIESKDGPALLKSLKTPEQLAKVSKEIAADPRTKDFALPTGKAHTAEEFIERATELLGQGVNAE